MQTKNIIHNFNETFNSIKVLQTPSDTYIYDSFTDFIIEVDEHELEEIYTHISGKVQKNGSSNKADLQQSLLYLQQKGALRKNMVTNVAPNDVKTIRTINDFYEENCLPRKFNIELTEDCNLRCTYCFFTQEIFERSHQKSTISYENAVKGIDYYFEKYTRGYQKLSEGSKEFVLDVASPNISWWGGEPLLEYSLMKKTKAYFDSLPWNDYGIGEKHLRYSFTSNFTQVSDEMIDFFIKNNFYIFISLDGDQESNDKNRLFANGQGTFSTVIKNIEKFISRNPEYCKKHLFINAVQAKNNDALECKNFLENHFNINSENKKINSIIYSVEREFGTIFTKDELSVDENAAFAKLVDHLKTLDEEELSQRILDNKSLSDHLDYVVKTYKHVNTDMPEGGKENTNLFSCPIGHDVIFVSAKGEFHACEKTDYSLPIGNVEKGLDESRITDFYNKYYDKINKKCSSCWAFRFCKMCPAKNSNGSDFIEPIDSECEIKRESIAKEFEKYLILSEDENLYQNIVRILDKREYSFLDYSSSILTNKEYGKACKCNN